MTFSNANLPAFPAQEMCEANTSIEWGLSKREYFAAMAMQGILSTQENGNGITEAKIAEWSVQNADALLAELAKQS